MPLPFVTAPDVQLESVGDETTGILQFPIFNSLLVGERILINEIGYQSEVTAQTHRLAQTIRDVDALPEETANLVAARLMARHIGIPVTLEPLEDAIRLREHQLIREIDNLLAAQNEAQMNRMVTAAIVCRMGKVDPECAAWTDEKTAGLTEGLRNAIYAFMLREQRGGAEPADPNVVLQTMAASLGKPNLTQSTGETSSGGSMTCGLTAPTSPENALPGAQKASFGRHSKPVNDH